MTARCANRPTEPYMIGLSLSEVEANTDYQIPPKPAVLEETLGEKYTDFLEHRWALHRHPCLSQDEGDSARRVKDWLLSNAKPNQVIDALGGHGLAAIFDTKRPGPTVMLRSELDALPLDELDDIPHRSRRPGIAHKCGHDGHTASLCGVAVLLKAHPLPAGRVVLLFQPAEETGTGARAVLADSNFSKITPDWIFGLHNVPGLPLGQVALKPGPFAAASEGLKVSVIGKASHASEPHLGHNPTLAVAQIINAYLALPGELAGMHANCLITPTSIQMGDGGFGISPDRAELSFTVRAVTNHKLSLLVERLREKASLIGSAFGLRMEFSRHDPFPATVNHKEGVRILERGFAHLGSSRYDLEEGFPWSEDFGEFLLRVPGAFFALGAGEDCPPLHSVEYDFPDQLLQPAALSLYTAAWIASQERPGVR
jgi:amidohydrolase